MIVLDNNEKDIVIPDYNDLENKPSINGVVLEGNKTAGELGIDIDTTNFYTKSQADDKFQLKGNYLTSIPDEYITETELNSKNYATNSDVNEEIGKLDSSLSVEIDKCLSCKPIIILFTAKYELPIYQATVIEIDAASISDNPAIPNIANLFLFITTFALRMLNQD